MRLASVHAVHHLVGLARRARHAVIEGRYRMFRDEFLSRYRSGETLVPSGFPA
jgi:queuine/archaeosine tRNA-ribosyltransferase